MTQFFLQSAEAEQKRKCDGAFCVFYDTKDKNRTDAFFFFHTPKARKTSNNYFIPHNFERFKRKGRRNSVYLFLYKVYTKINKDSYSTIFACSSFKNTTLAARKVINFLLKTLSKIDDISSIFLFKESKLQYLFQLKDRYCTC
jgi:hypothetical protein